MTITQLRSPCFYGLTGKRCERRGTKKWAEAFRIKDERKVLHDCHFKVTEKRELRWSTVTKCSGSISDQQPSECGLSLSSVQEKLASDNGTTVSKGIFDSTVPAIISQPHTRPSIQT